MALDIHSHPLWCSVRLLCFTLLMAFHLVSPHNNHRTNGGHSGEIKDKIVYSVDNTKLECPARRPCSGCICCPHMNKTDVIVLCKGHNITDVPSGLPPDTVKIEFDDTGIVNLTGTEPPEGVPVPEHYYPESKFCQYPRLKQIGFSRNQYLRTIYPGAFGMACTNLPPGQSMRLMKLEIKQSPLLENVYSGALGTIAGLQNLVFRDTGLQRVPEWGLFSFGIENALLTELNLAENMISRLPSYAFQHLMGQIGTLNLEGNQLEVIENLAFSGMHVEKLVIRNNPQLYHLEPHAFKDMKSLRELDLSGTAITHLPASYMQNLESLTLENVPSLKVTLPWIIHLPELRVAKLTYPFHCCAFAFSRLVQNFQRECTTSLPTTTPSTTFMAHDELGTWDSHDGRLRREVTLPRWIKQYERKRTEQPSRVRRDLEPGEWEDDDILDEFLPDEYYWQGDEPLLVDQWSDGALGNQSRDNLGDQQQSYLQILENGVWHGSTLDPEANHSQIEFCGLGYFNKHLERVQCTPLPNALNPCEDLMGYTWLRVIIWFVWITALIGNFVVLVVTLCSKHKLTVPKFLMCNLSFADLCLGIYLLLLAAYDISTQGAYFNYAIQWQYEGGCQVAGFLATFSACLGIFTLTVITLERWYAISHAINITKRIRMRQASIIMVCGWGYSVVFSALPNFGIGGYEATSICLPMRVTNRLDLGYVTTLLLINSIAFIIIAGCYIDMFRQVRGNNSLAGRSDATIAKRMAILVFTDFLCLFPIAFFGITAAAGAPLITITDSKILLVFFFPLNSCANPFLYAILTKQFKKDFFSLMGSLGLFQQQAARYRGNITAYPNSLSQSRNSMSQGHYMNRQPQFAPVTMSYEQRVIRLNGLPQSGSEAAGSTRKQKVRSKKQRILGGIYRLPFVGGVINRFDDSRKSTLSDTLSTEVQPDLPANPGTSQNKSRYNDHSGQELKSAVFCKDVLLLKSDNYPVDNECGATTDSSKYRGSDRPIMLREMTSLDAIHSETLDNESGSSAPMSSSASENDVAQGDSYETVEGVHLADRTADCNALCHDSNCTHEKETLLRKPSTSSPDSIGPLYKRPQSPGKVS